MLSFTISCELAKKSCMTALHLCIQLIISRLPNEFQWGKKTRHGTTQCDHTGVSCGQELEATGSMPKGPEGDSLQKELAEKAWQQVTDLYVDLESAIRDPSRREAFSQPWKS